MREQRGAIHGIGCSHIGQAYHVPSSFYIARWPMPRTTLLLLVGAALAGCGGTSTKQDRAAASQSAKPSKPATADSMQDVTAAVERQLGGGTPTIDLSSGGGRLGCEHRGSALSTDPALVASTGDPLAATESLSSCATASGRYRVLLRSSVDRSNKSNLRWRVYNTAGGKAQLLVDVQAPEWTDKDDEDTYHSETELRIEAMRDECTCIVVSVAIEKWLWDGDAGEPDYDQVARPAVVFNLATNARQSSLPTELDAWVAEARTQQTARAAQLQQKMDATTQQNVAAPPAGHILNGAEAKQMLDLSLSQQGPIPAAARGQALTSCGTNVTETSSAQTLVSRAWLRGQRPTPPELLGSAAQQLVTSTGLGTLRKPCLSPDGRFLVTLTSEQTALGDVLVVHAFDFQTMTHRILQRVEPLARRTSAPLDPRQPRVNTASFTYVGSVAIQIPFSINGGGGGPHFTPRTYALVS